MPRIGFDVPRWTHNRPITEYTNEELVEYYYKLRLAATLSGEKGEVSPKFSSSTFLTIDMQDEIIRRMSK